MNERTVIVALPPEYPEVFDWRVNLDMAIRDFARSAKQIAEALSAGGERAAYVRSNARHFGEPLPLQLVCSVWMAMEGLGTTTGSQAAPSFSTRAPEQGAFDDRCLVGHMGGEPCTTRCRDPRDCSAERLPSTLQAAE